MTRKSFILYAGSLVVFMCMWVTIVSSTSLIFYIESSSRCAYCFFGKIDVQSYLNRCSVNCFVSIRLFEIGRPLSFSDRHLQNWRVIQVCSVSWVCMIAIVSVLCSSFPFEWTIHNHHRSRHIAFTNSIPSNNRSKKKKNEDFTSVGRLYKGMRWSMSSWHISTKPKKIILSMPRRQRIMLYISCYHWSSGRTSWGWVVVMNHLMDSLSFHMNTWQEWAL